MARWSRPVVAFIATAAMSAVLLSAVGAFASGSCGSAKGCSWKQIGFDGLRKVYTNSSFDYYMADYNRSAKNGFGNRRIRIKAQNQDVLDCLPPGGQDQNLEQRSFFVAIGARGNSC